MRAAGNPVHVPKVFHCPTWPRCGCPDGTVDLACPGIERLSVPPAGPTQRVCRQWPECQCDGDCTWLTPARPLGELIIVSLTAVALVVAVLALWLGWR